MSLSTQELRTIEDLDEARQIVKALYFNDYKDNKEDFILDFCYEYYKEMIDGDSMSEDFDKIDLLGVTPYTLGILIDEIEAEKTIKTTDTEKIKVPIEVANFIEKFIDNVAGINWENDLLHQHDLAYYSKDEVLPDAKVMMQYSPFELAEILIKGYEVEYPDIEEGDIVISNAKGSADIRIVEGADEECILLVNGIRDLSYSLPHQLSTFWKEWKILCKKKDRKDLI